MTERDPSRHAVPSATDRPGAADAVPGTTGPAATRTEAPAGPATVAGTDGTTGGKTGGKTGGAIGADTSTDPGNASGDGARPVEVGGQKGPEPTRYGDWEGRGRCTDF